MRLYHNVMKRQAFQLSWFSQCGICDDIYHTSCLTDGAIVKPDGCEIFTCNSCIQYSPPNDVAREVRPLIDDKRALTKLIHRLRQTYSVVSSSDSQQYFLPPCKNSLLCKSLVVNCNTLKCHIMQHVAGNDNSSSNRESLVETFEKDNLKFTADVLSLISSDDLGDSLDFISVFKI